MINTGRDDNLEKDKTLHQGVFLTQWGSDSYELSLKGKSFELNRYDLETLAEQMKDNGLGL